MSEPPQFVEANLRDAWPHEAHGFTPWLVENLDHISEAMGIPLESEGSEVRVGRFSADILARNPLDDTRVLIENQLEAGDHNHLGQILTYLAGLDAKTVVWIASSFTDEHLSALNWLNQHIEDGFSFFAIRVKVVRIGDSPFAPIFEVVERPNTWDRQLHAAATVTTARTERAENRFTFWQAFVDKIPEELERGGAPQYVSNRWRILDDLGLIISLMLAKESIGIFIRTSQGGSNEETAERLRRLEPELSRRLGVPCGDSERHFYFDGIKSDYSDSSQQQVLIDWLAGKAELYEKTLREVFRGSAG